jgi:hypothetical protein
VEARLDRGVNAVYGLVTAASLILAIVAAVQGAGWLLLGVLAGVGVVGLLGLLGQRRA